MDSIKTLSFKLGRAREIGSPLFAILRMHESKSNLFWQISSDRSVIEKKLDEIESIEGGACEFGPPWMRLWQAVKRTEGEEMMFWRRLENLPWWY